MGSSPLERFMVMWTKVHVFMCVDVEARGCFPSRFPVTIPPEPGPLACASHAQLLTRLPGIQTQAPHLQKKHFTIRATSLASHRTPWPVPTEAEERGSMPPWKVQRLYFDSSPQGREAKRSILI